MDATGRFIANGPMLTMGSRRLFIACINGTMESKSEVPIKKNESRQVRERDKNVKLSKATKADTKMTR